MEKVDAVPMILHLPSDDLTYTYDRSLNGDVSGHLLLTLQGQFTQSSFHFLSFVWFH